MLNQCSIGQTLSQTLELRRILTGIQQLIALPYGIAPLADTFALIQGLYAELKQEDKS